MFIVDPQTNHPHKHTPKSAEILCHGFFSCFQDLLRLVLIYLFCTPALCPVLRFPFGIRACLLMLGSRSLATFRQNFLAQNFLIISFQRWFWHLPVRPKCCNPWISDASGTHCCIRNTQKVRTITLEEARHQSYLNHLFILHDWVSIIFLQTFSHSTHCVPNTCHSLSTSCALELLSLYIYLVQEGFLYLLFIPGIPTCPSNYISSWKHSGLLTQSAGILIRHLASVHPLFNNCFTFSSVFQIY